MHGHETALMLKIVGGEPEEVAVFRVVRQLPGRPVLTATQTSGDHLQVPRDVGSVEFEPHQALARQRQQLAFKQVDGAYLPTVEPDQARAEPARAAR
jgi:hypothetical protein